MTDETGPLAGLPRADRALLARPPLEMVVLEVRFICEPQLSEIPVDLGLSLRERLEAAGHAYVRQEPAEQQQLVLGPLTPAAGFARRGWKLFTADAASEVLLLPGLLLVQTSTYERWSSSLRPVLEATMGVLQEHLRPALVDRIGLRYIDRLVDPQATTPSAWRGRVHPALLAALDHPALATLVQGAQQQLELELGPAQGALMRHGPFVDSAAGGATSYLLDVDVFDATSQRFDTDEVMRRAEVLHTTAASLFQVALTPEHLQRLQQGTADEQARETAS